MMKLAILAVAGLALKTCQPAPIPVSESCEVLRETLFKDGHLTFSPAETATLSPTNETKLVAIKSYYRDNCPN